MKHFRRIVTLLVLAAALLPTRSLAAGTALGRGQTASIQSRVESLRTEMFYIQMRADMLTRERDSARERVKAGLAPENVLTTLEAQLAELMSKMSLAETELQEAVRLAALTKAVDVDFKSAGIRQAAETLSKAADIRIAVKNNVPKDLYVTLSAQHSPLGTVLELMAMTANLSIAPGENGSIVLAPWSRITIDGKEVAVGGSQPWSDEWPFSGVLDTRYGQIWTGLLAAGIPDSIPQGYASQWSFAGTQQPLVAGLSASTFIVGEPGKNDKGEPGILLTYYSIDRGRIVPGVRHFHHFAVEDPESKEEPAE